MRMIKFSILVFFLLATASFAQTVSDSTKPAGKNDLKKENRHDDPLLQKGKDRFIDRDGDGINDNRVKGMGFRNKKNHFRDNKDAGSPNDMHDGRKRGRH